MHQLDKHKEAVKGANADTIDRWGPSALPVEPDTQQHKYWLARYDRWLAILNQN